MKSKVSVAMAVYNGEKYIKEQIDSIIGQLKADDELIISVDPCGDASKTIAQAYAAKDERIRVIDGPGRGVVRNFENALRQTSGGYIFLSDQDDVWESDKIELMLERMRELDASSPRECPLLVFTDLCVVDADLELISPSFMRFSKLDGSRTALRQLLIQNVVTGCTVMINVPLKKLALDHGATDDILMHDWWLALAASAFGKIAYIDAALVRYRQHGSNEVGAKNTRSLRYLLRKAFGGRDITASIKRTTHQAKQFALSYKDSLSADDRRLIEGYAALYEMGKIGRICFMIKNRLFKYGAMRKVAQIIWG